MPDWPAIGVCATLTSLVLQHLKPFEKLHQIVVWLFAQEVRCQTLLWTDIPPDNFHICPMVVPPFQGIGHACTADSLEVVFSGALQDNQAKIFHRSEKLAELARHRRLIYTDGSTLRAFQFCLLEQNDLDAITDINQFDDVKVARIRPAGAFRQDLTKKTLEGLLEKYPPWYREKLVITNGPSIDHPIQCRDDLYRAGWVFAVGLSEASPLQHTLVEDKVIRAAISRLLEKLKDNIRPWFVNNPGVKTIIPAAENLVAQNTDSGTGALHQPASQGDCSGLSQTECIFAISLFNERGDLSKEQALRLTSILNVVLKCAYRGLFEVIKHFKHPRERMPLPPGLQDVKDKIYIDVGPVTKRGLISHVHTLSSSPQT